MVASGQRDGTGKGIAKVSSSLSQLNRIHVTGENERVHRVEMRILSTNGHLAACSLKKRGIV